jgi:hypothetical protein
MTLSPNLALPYLSAAQAQKHVTVNEALRLLDAVVMLAVLDRDLAAPPPSPADGARYIAAAGAAGAWTGHAGAIAAWQDGAWTFIVPRPGFLAYVVDEAALVVFDGTSWQGAGGGSPSVLDNLTRLGVGTAADATNPFAAKLNNALWTARSSAEGGDGTLRYKMNKESAAATLSLLMQTAYSGRAEIGLTGDDDLHVKVSPDGSAWFEAIRIERASGRVVFPSGGGGREMLTANRTYYVRSDGDDANTGLADTPAGAFATIQRAVDVVASLDLSIWQATIRVGDGVYTTPVTLRRYVGALPPIIRGNNAAPTNVHVNVTGKGFVSSGTQPWRILDLKVSATATALEASSGGEVQFGNLVFGAATIHMAGASRGTVLAESSYAVTAAANFHLYASQQGMISVPNATLTFTGSQAYAIFAYADALSVINAYSMTFTGGTITGTRYQVTENSMIKAAAGAAYFPGNVAGAAMNGGLYL